MAEFEPRGFELERQVGLVADADAIRAHPRANREVEVRALDPAPGADDALWEAVIAVQVADNKLQDDPVTDFETFARARQGDLRALFAAGRGAWYVALAEGEVAGACGLVATGPRGRFQLVVTAPAHRRRGICRRLVSDAATDATARHGLESLVIVADADYHARGIYESLGFAPRERVCAVSRPPG